MGGEVPLLGISVYNCTSLLYILLHTHLLSIASTEHSSKCSAWHQPSQSDALIWALGIARLEKICYHFQQQVGLRATWYQSPHFALDLTSQFFAEIDSSFWLLFFFCTRWTMCFRTDVFGVWLLRIKLLYFCFVFVYWCTLIFVCIYVNRRGWNWWPWPSIVAAGIIPMLT